MKYSRVYKGEKGAGKKIKFICTLYKHVTPNETLQIETHDFANSFVLYASF